MVSSGEFYAAVQDSNLSDVSIASSESTPVESTPGDSEYEPAIICHGQVVGGRYFQHLLPSVPVDHGEDAMLYVMNAFSIDNDSTTLLGTADSIAQPSTDGQGETLDELNSPCPWMSNDNDDNENTQLSHNCL